MENRRRFALYISDDEARKLQGTSVKMEPTVSDKGSVRKKIRGRVVRKLSRIAARFSRSQDSEAPPRPPSEGFAAEEDDDDVQDEVFVLRKSSRSYSLPVSPGADDFGKCHQ